MTVEQNEGEPTPKRRKFIEPRYVGEIKSPNVSTPRRAKRSLGLMKRKLFEQKKRIRILQQKNRRLIKKINNLEDLVNHLKNRYLISESQAESLMVS